MGGRLGGFCDVFAVNIFELEKEGARQVKTEQEKEKKRSIKEWETQREGAVRRGRKVEGVCLVCLAVARARKKRKERKTKSRIKLVQRAGKEGKD